MTPRCELAPEYPDSYFLWFHDCLNQESSHIGGALPLGPDGWQMVSKDPLTISPSILCRTCGTHGFFTNGQWVPA